MSELRSAIESFQAEDLRGVSDEQLEADFTELQQACQALEAERLRWREECAALRRTLGESAFESAYRSGRALSWEQAVSEVLPLE